MMHLLTYLCISTLLATQAQKLCRKRVSWLIGLVALGCLHLSCLAHNRGWSRAADGHVSGWRSAWRPCGDRDPRDRTTDDRVPVHSAAGGKHGASPGKHAGAGEQLLLAPPLPRLNTSAQCGRAGSLGCGYAGRE